MKPELIITGHGRSGSNWLLSLFDKSPHSFCRSEINEIPGNIFSSVPSSQIRGVISEEDLSKLDVLLNQSRYSYSQRDRLCSEPKDYLYESSRRLTGENFFRRRARILRKLSSFYQENGEFKIPWWLGSRRRIDRAIHVYKFLLVPDWIAWILRNRPKTQIVHLIRHPIGYINSWHKRYFIHQNPNKIKSINIKRLERIRTSDPNWPVPWDASKVNEFTHKELELWYWRYANEVTLEAGLGKDNYSLINFRDLTCNTEEILQRFYRKISLEYTKEVARKVSETSSKSSSLSEKWKKEATNEDIALAKQVLNGSPLARYFELDL